MHISLPSLYLRGSAERLNANLDAHSISQFRFLSDERRGERRGLSLGDLVRRYFLVAADFHALCL